MNNCGTCKHWGVDLSNQHQYTSVGLGNQKRCYRIADSAEHGDDVLEDKPAYMEDGSGYFWALMTKPDFGCVLWEPK